MSAIRDRLEAQLQDKACDLVVHLSDDELAELAGAYDLLGNAARIEQHERLVERRDLVGD